MLLYLIWLLPLLGAVLLWAFGPQLKSWAGPIGSALVGVSFIATLTAWGDATSATGAHASLVTWLTGWSLGLQLDKLSLVWSLVITVAAAEAAIGLAIVAVTFRRTPFVDVDEVSALKG